MMETGKTVLSSDRQVAVPGPEMRCSSTSVGDGTLSGGLGGLFAGVEAARNLRAVAGSYQTPLCPSIRLFRVISLIGKEFKIYTWDGGG